MELRRTFSSLLDEALFEEGLVLSSLTKQYVIDLLVRFVDRDELHQFERGERGAPVLTWLYERAQSGSRSERAVAYRHLGDVALFVGGFFNDHIENSSVGTGYYIDMGRAGYDSVYRILGNPVMIEMVKGFPSLLEAFIHIGGSKHSHELDRLFDRYEKNPSSGLLFQRFRDHRVIPILGGIEC